MSSVTLDAKTPIERAKTVGLLFHSTSYPGVTAQTLDTSREGWGCAALVFEAAASTSVGVMAAAIDAYVQAL